MEPSPRLTRALRQYHDAEFSVGRARQLLHATIAAELADGIRQAQLVKTTGYSREYLRRIALAAAQPQLERGQPAR